MKLLPFASLVLSLNAVAQPKSYDFPIYTNKVSGRQLTGQHAPAASPALSPVEAQKRFVVPPGFDVRLFAAEPEVVNPVAMTWDERGRLWVLELYEYPLGAKPGEKGRDRIKILEDTDGDGRADKVTVFADGLNLATGLALGYGGAFVGQAPDFLFLEDTDGDGKADRRTVLKTGFGLHDRHELLNGFTWGPDGWLYLTHGVFTHSKVRDPSDPDDRGVVIDAAVGRYHPRSKTFEVFADGTSNPWGLDFDRSGNAFVSACVIDHLFHLAPGGIYTRQGGTPAYPYAYELLPSIVDHKHFMAAYAGINIYQGNQYPSEWLGEVIIGNIHQSALNHDHLEPRGASFKASSRDDFLTANDGWFRPVSTQTGPDGALWVMDWYDKYPCYQNANADPEGVDREHGRIWRVVYVGNDKAKKVPSRPEVKMDLAQESGDALVKLLAHPNIWQRRMAQRILSERGSKDSGVALKELFVKGSSTESRLAALWTLHSSGQLDETILDSAARAKESPIRAWSARLTGERRNGNEQARERLLLLAEDGDAAVRLAVATAARQWVSGSLTVNSSLPEGQAQVDVGEILVNLTVASKRVEDPVLPFLIWMAAEPAIARDPSEALHWLEENGVGNMPLSAQLAKKIMRRICDRQEPELLRAAVEFVSEVAPLSPPLAVAALDGLIEGQKGRATPPKNSAGPLFAMLESSGSASLSDRGRQLGALWGDPHAIKRIIETIAAENQALDARIKAIQIARQLKSEAMREALVNVATGAAPDGVALEAIRALSESGGGDDVAQRLISKWRTFSFGKKRATADVLVSRSNWSKIFLDAVEDKQIQASEIPTTALRALFQSNNPNTQNRANRLIGRFRESTADKLKLIAARRRVVLEGTPNLEAGHETAKKTCLVCHRLHGEGAEIGPDLTGVGRSSLDALLANVIDPNQVIGKGYENVVVETKDGRTISGRLVENTDSRVKLLSAGPREDVVSKQDIASMQITEMSVMPEGLEQMPDEEFRNLIWYILNPPGDLRPMTPDLRRQLIGDDGKKSAAATDGESIALWNPPWKVNSGDGDLISKVPEFSGHHNVLITRGRPGGEFSLVTQVDLRKGENKRVELEVCAQESEPWLLRITANDRLLGEEIVTGNQWKRLVFDLATAPPGPVQVQVTQAPVNGARNAAFWGSIEILESPYIARK